MFKRTFAAFIVAFGIVMSPQPVRAVEHDEVQEVEPSPSPITIVVQNTFGEGWGVDGVFNWLLAHYYVLVAKSPEKIEERWRENPSKPAQDLLDKYDPSIIVLQEVMPYMEGSTTIRTLEDYDYVTCVSQGSGKKDILERATVIGSKFQGEMISEFKMPGSGDRGGECGFYIPELDLTIFAIHPSAFDKKVRTEQLEYTSQFIKKYHEEYPEHNLVLAGDFNESYEKFSYLFESLPIVHYGAPTFPRQSLLDELQHPQWFPVKQLVAPNGMRDLDHIYLPKRWNVLEFETFETSSDHLGLMVRATP